MGAVANDAAHNGMVPAKDRTGGRGVGGKGYLASKGRGAKSNASLAQLDLADEETVRDLLGKIPVGHQNERTAIAARLETQYPR